MEIQKQTLYHWDELLLGSHRLCLSKENLTTKAWMPRRKWWHISVIPHLEAASEGSQVQDQPGLHESLPLKNGNGRLETIAQ